MIINPFQIFFVPPSSSTPPPPTQIDIANTPRLAPISASSYSSQMTGSSSCSRLLPLLAWRRPCQLYDAATVASYVLPPPAFASAFRARSITSHASARDIQQRASLPCPGLRRCDVSRLGSTQSRGKKTKSSFKLDDLPQGLVNAEPLPDVQDDASPAYPTVILQARRNMQKFDNCVLLTRVGGFYELYFQQAEEYGPLLNLKVARKKTNAGPIPMAGFPFVQLEKYLRSLVLDHNCYVAVAEEFPNDPSDKVKSGGLMFDRRVTRIITPGTLIDENFIDPYTNNYVLAIHIDRDTRSLNENQGLGLLSAPIGLAWLDISTGQFYTQATTITSLSSILSRVGPREIVIDEVLQSQRGHHLFSVLGEDKHFITFAPRGDFLPVSEWRSMLESEIPAQTVADFTSNEAQAGSLLLQYVKDRLRGMSMKLQPPQRHENLAVLTMDKNTMRALEIKQTMKEGVFKGSLLHAVRRTVTKGGARLLDSWLSAPSTCLETIQARQDLAEYFIQNEDRRDEIVILLRRSHDSQRLVQKFAFGRGDEDDLIGLANTIYAVRDIYAILTNTTEIGQAGLDANNGLSIQPPPCFVSLLSCIKLEEPLKLAERIRTSIDEEGLVQQHQNQDNEAVQLLNLAEDIVAAEGTQGDAASLPRGPKKKKPTSLREHYADDNMAFVMKPEASPGLRDLHIRLSALLQEKLEIGDTLRERLGAPSLTLRWTPNLGHICHVKGKDVRAESITGRAAVSSSRSTRTFHVAEWTALGQRIHQTRFEIETEEARIFAELRAAVVVNLVKLRRNASVLDELDVTTSFARLAVEQGLIRPVLNRSMAHTIIGGRHLTVEGGLREQGRSFTRNDCLVGHTADTTTASPIPDSDLTSGRGGIPTSNSPTHSSEGRLWLITGPNMAGKSTYLRQNALITILAQAGCYVPALHATLGIADAVFSRVGSADNLYRDQSTFMVEMLETAQILRYATPRSFVIMDEIGRGTTPEDGEAVAFACLHHLATVNKCRALFATHFHKLADLVHERGLHVSNASEGGGPVEMYCTDIEEDGEGGFVYVHKLRKGVNRHSHALKVARLAGLPNTVITIAKEVLREHHYKS
ncbi:putative domain V [Rosellinia necatrix]|uniref:DNA mismatch repair protein n=1 Tax=Rosellinia necatrix TaxID=77044 RepID=A0A1W2TDX3_ROSNE|nr:putative domain V [Rosellinia necatrix]